MKKKYEFKTSRVNWQIGQALLPGHFYAQESSLRQELSSRFSMQMAPAWGLFHLKWNEDQLAHGAIAIEELTLVMPGSGTLVDVPGNSRALRLSLPKTTLTTASVYLHLSSDHVATQYDDSDDDVELIQQIVEVSARPTSDTSDQSFKLAELDYVAGKWTLSTRYIPPSLRLVPTFFADLLLRASAIYERFQQAIDEEIQVDYLSVETYAAARQARRGAWEFRGLLADVGEDAEAHPLVFFKAVRQLYVELCLFRQANVSLGAIPYRHEQIADDLSVLLSFMEESLRIPVANSPYHEFEKKGVDRVCVVPSTIHASSEVFLLVQKPRATSSFRVSSIKFASPSRLPIVVERALTGLQVEKLAGPPFYHGLSASMEFYTIRPGQEWDAAMREKEVVFHDRADLDGYRFFIYWRQ